MDWFSSETRVPSVWFAVCVIALLTVAACGSEPGRTAPQTKTQTAPQKNTAEPEADEEVSDEEEEAPEDDTVRTRGETSWNDDKASQYLRSAFTRIASPDAVPKGLIFDERWQKNWEPAKARLYSADTDGSAIVLKGQATSNADVAELLARMERGPGVIDSQVVHVMRVDESDKSSPSLFEINIRVPERTQAYRDILVKSREKALGVAGGLNPLSNFPSHSKNAAEELDWDLIGIIRVRRRGQKSKAWLRDSSGLAHVAQPGDELSPGLILEDVKPDSRSAILLYAPGGVEPKRFTLFVEQASNLDEVAKIKIIEAEESKKPVEKPFKRSDVQDLMDENRDDILACAEESNERLLGALNVEFTVSTDGKVSDAKITDNKYEGSPVGKCMTKIIGGLLFPEFTGNAVSITYPFSFR